VRGGFYHSATLCASSPQKTKSFRLFFPFCYNAIWSTMDEILQTITDSESEIARAHREFESQGRISEALAAYQKIEHRLERLDIRPLGHPHRERGRVLAVCLGRQTECLLVLGRYPEAAETSERQLAAARLSGDLITLADALLMDGYTRILKGNLTGGEHAMREARRLFESADTEEHLTGLAKYWMLGSELILKGTLPGGSEEALDAADHAIKVLQVIEDRAMTAAAYTARAKAHRALGDEQAAAADLQRALQVKAKIQ
jgi:tetratricopeptide (TPR) repeat protein